MSPVVTSSPPRPILSECIFPQYLLSIVCHSLNSHFDRELLENSHLISIEIIILEISLKINQIVDNGIMDSAIILETSESALACIATCTGVNSCTLTGYEPKHAVAQSNNIDTVVGGDSKHPAVTHRYLIQHPSDFESEIFPVKFCQRSFISSRQRCWCRRQ